MEIDQKGALNTQIGNVDITFYTIGCELEAECWGKMVPMVWACRHRLKECTDTGELQKPLRLPQPEAGVDVEGKGR